MVQLELGEMIEPQVLVPLKSPVSAMLLMVKGASPALVSVTACVPLGTPTGWLAKPRLAGASKACGSRIPVPVARITCGLPEPLSVRVMAPTLATAADGV